MESFKSIVFTLLLVFGLLGPTVQAQSPTLLLQEGLYAEKTEGDLEKAIDLYEQVLVQYKDIERFAARATYQLGTCHLKKGEKEKAAKYFQQVISNYPEQKSIGKKADDQLKKIKPETKESVFEQVDHQVLRFLGEQFGKTALEAGQQHLLVNSHIYYVDRNGFSYNGGMNAFYNWTGRTITQKTRFGGTSYQNQTHYGVDGHELNTEIVPDKTRPNHWQIYWTPDEPLAPEESLYYGWSMNNKRKVHQLPGGIYSLTMQNQFGSPAIETFFLVLPKELKISQGNSPTGSQELLNFNVYWWTKTVQQGENHLERVQLEKDESAGFVSMLKNKITTNIAKSPDGDRLTVQYAVIGVCKAANVPYQWDKSRELGGEKVRRYIQPVHFEDITAETAIQSILEPVGLTYEIDENGVYLTAQDSRYVSEPVNAGSGDDKLLAEDLTTRGWKLWGQRKLVEAEEAFRQAIKCDPTYENAYQGLGWAQLNQGKKLNAKDSFEKCVKLNPKNSAALNGLGWIADGQGNTDEAIQWWQKAVGAQPGATASLSGLTKVYMQREEYDKAIKYYKMWLKAEPNNKQAKEGLQKAKASNKN